MTASISISVFHQWLLADPASKASACAIILHGSDAWTSGRLIQELAEYLNEYDEEGDGRWLPATRELVERIARDPSHRRLLGMEENGASEADTAEEHRKTITALGRRGHVVFSSPGSSDESWELPGAFHAGIGLPGEVSEPCHVILNPDLMDQKCIAHIIGDVFLEWLHSEIRRSSPIQDIR